MCSLVHVCEDEKILGSINQLELNPVINEKIEMFKGMREMAAAIKKSTTKIDQREKRPCINPHRSTNAAFPRQTFQNITYLMITIFTK
jgi:hypothetical protein